MAYSNTRYSRYRHSPKLITPIQAVPKIQDIEKLEPEKAIQPYYSYKGLDEKRRAYTYAQQDKQTQTFLANYNDPTELNSYIDALTNREAVSKKFGDAWGTISTTSGFVSVLAFAGSIIAAALAPFTGGASLAVAAPLAKVGAIAAIPSIPAAVDVTVEKGIKPIIAGKPKEALLNTLMNLGETMDFAANPVKGLIMEGGQGFIKGLGIGSEGRVNYDYDTGFFLTDMLLETITDPMNWISFGTSTALKSATKTVGRTITDELINNTVSVVNKQLAKSVGEITTEGAERISKQVSKTVAQVSRDWAESSFKNLTEEAQQLALKKGRDKIQRSLVNALKKELPDATSNQLDIILKKAGRSVSTGQFTKSTINQISDITFDSLSTTVIKSLAGMQHYAEGFEKFMTKGAMLSSGYGLGVEAAKTGWKGIKAWQNNYTLKTLKKAQVFDSTNGLDIKQWDKAKNLWEASYNYTTALTGEKAQRDMNSFYVFAAQQFNRDKQLIAKILQDNPTALAKSTALDAQFKALYGCEFREYISILKNIDSKESGMFKQFINYAEATEKALPDQAISKPLKFSMKTGKQLYSAQNTESIAKLQNNLIEQVQKAIKISKDKVELTDRFYTIKMNNAYVNAMLVNNPVIAETLMNIQSSKHIGALLDKIKGDINALGNNVPAHIPVAVRTIKDAGASFTNIKTLYDNIGMLPLPNINKINIDDFKRYVLDQIFGENKSVSELLAEFDSITMPSLMNSLEVMLYEYGFKFADYPTLKEQIASVYKQFLEEQQRAGIEMVGATIVEDFTKSVDDLAQYMPQYADDLQELSRANLEIRTALAQVKNANLELLESVFTNKKTIFEIANTRQLADAGLALKVVAIKENLNLFNIPEGISGNVVEAANRLGKSINHLKQSLQQYHVHFGKVTSEEISKAYKEFRKQFLDNPDFELAGLPAFKYLKDTDDTIEQFAQLIEFNKASKDVATSKQFKDILYQNMSTNTYMNLVNPSSLMVTDFAWDAVAQTAAMAEKHLNETLINNITAYKNLSLNSKKITNDFQAMRDLLSANKLDRPKMLMQERYIKAATKINNMLEFLEQHYASRFNKTIAQEQLENVRNVLINFPELNEKYSNLVDTLEAYWRGEKTFQQSPKYMRGQEGFIDEFTPFWESVKEMNSELNKAINEYNDAVAKGLTEATAQFKNVNITPWDPVREQQELNKLINRATEQNAKGAFYNLFNLTPEQFKTELAYRKRFITFKEEDVADYQLNKMFEKFKKNLPEEIKFYHDEAAHRYWFVLDKSQEVTMSGRQVYLNGNALIRLQNKHQFNEFELVDKFINDPNNPGITKTLNELDDILETLTGSHLGDSQGEYFSKEMLEKMYEQMPEEVRNLLPDITEMTDKQFFDSYIFNESVLGSMHSKAELGIYASNMITNTSNAITQAQGYLKPKTEYVNTIFDSAFSISGPNSIYSNFTEQGLLDALQANPDYKLIALVEDKKYGVKVREILPTSLEAIRKGKELGAVVVPLQTYKDMYNVVNHRLGSTGMAKLWNRIMYTYKFGYLCRPGAWIRNWFDTNIKTRIELGDDFATYKNQATKIINERARIMRLATDANGLVNKESIQAYFKANPDSILNWNLWQELDFYFSQGVSGNVMRQVIGEDAWATFTKLTGDILDLPNKTEEYNRLAMYLFELDRGADATSALARLSKTHFDYSFKTQAEQLVEMVFPFTTFSLRNYSYWIEAIEKHPWIMRNYIHLMKPHWDFKDYTPEELARDYRVQTQILYGQLKLAEFEDKVITFKANPSIQDAIQMFTDPINNVYEKLAAPISVPLKLMQKEYTQPTSLIPVLGPMIQSINTMSKTGTPLPSAIGVQKKYTQRTGNVKFKNKNLTKTNTFTDNTYRTPKYRNNIVFDSYSVKGIKQYRVNLYPVVDIAHEIKMRYSTNVYNRVKNRVKTDVYQGIRYRIRTDVNLFR